MTTVYFTPNPLETVENDHADVRPLEPPGTTTPPVYRRVEIGGFSSRIVAGLVALLVATSVGDFTNAKTVFDLVFPTTSSLNSWLLAVSLTGLAIVTTHIAGYLWREAHARRGLQGLSGAIVVVWLAAGALLGALRVAVSTSTGAASGQGPFGSLGQVGPSHPAVLAAVLGAVWVATGLVSFAIGYLAHDPAGAALGRLERVNERHSRELAAAQAAARAAAHVLATQQLNKARLRKAWRAAEASARARDDERRAWARIELVRVLGDPAATNDILPRP